MVVLSNPCASPSPRTKMYFHLLPACVDKSVSTPIIIFFSSQNLELKKEHELNPIPYPN